MPRLLPFDTRSPFPGHNDSVSEGSYMGCRCQGLLCRMQSAPYFRYFFLFILMHFGKGSHQHVKWSAVKNSYKTNYVSLFEKSTDLNRSISSRVRKDKVFSDTMRGCSQIPGTKQMFCRTWQSQRVALQSVCFCRIKKGPGTQCLQEPPCGSD